MASNPTTTTLKAAASRLYTTIGLFKSIIGKTETDQDTYLTWALAAASAAVENYCNRIFAQESILDLFRLSSSWPANSGWQNIILSRFPLTNIWAIVDSSCQTATLSSSMDASQTTMPAAAALIGAFPFNVVLDVGSKSEVVTVTSLSAGTTYNVARGVNSNATTHASGAALSVALGSSLYEFDAAASTISRLNSDGVAAQWSDGVVTALYSAGYIIATDTTRTLPYDIEDAVIRLMKYAWFTRDRDPTIRSTGEPGLGQRLYWVGPPGEKSNLPPDVAAILDNYRVPVIGTR